MGGLSATKSDGVGLIVRAVSFQDFQPTWSWSTNVTDGRTDRQTDRQTTCDCKTALCTKVHRGVIRPHVSNKLLYKLIRGADCTGGQLENCHRTRGTTWQKYHFAPMLFCSRDSQRSLVGWRGRYPSPLFTSSTTPASWLSELSDSTPRPWS